MLQPGRLPLTTAESEAVDALFEKHGDALLSLTRRDPGETGPVLAHIGADTYEIDPDGKVTKQRKRKAS
jgi:hypothetical protein